MEKQKMGRPLHSGRGYCWHKNAKAWMVRVTIEGKQIATYYKTEQEAIEQVARIRAELTNQETK